TYPNIPTGTTATNSLPLTISTAPDFVCGTPIVLTVTVKSDQITTTTTITLPTGTNGPVLRFNNSTPAVIRDNDPIGTNSYVVVSNIPSAISKVPVSLYLTHTFDSDLTISLISPDGVTNVLSRHEGGSGHNYGAACSPDNLRTTFDDDASTGIGAGTPPFVGTFKPDAPLSVYAGKNGTNVNGLWALRIVDDVQQDSGVLNCWSLSLATALCGDGGGTCPGADVTIGMTAAPDPVFV